MRLARGVFGAKRAQSVDEGRFRAQSTLMGQGRTLRFKHERFIDGSANQPPTFVSKC